MTKTCNNCIHSQPAEDKMDWMCQAPETAQSIANHSRRHTCAWQRAAGPTLYTRGKPYDFCGGDASWFKHKGEE